MPSRRASLLASAAILSAASAACDNPNPGAPLGTFSVRSALAADSCGGSAAALSPGSFDVTISNDHGVVYWFPNNGASSAYGSLSAAGTVTTSEVVADDVDQTDAGAGACVLQRNDTLSFTLAEGVAPASFTGAYTFTVTPASGAVCTDQLAVHGGGYSALPCTVSYSLAGARQ